MRGSLGERSDEPAIAANETWSGQTGGIESRNGIFKQSNTMGSIMLEESKPIAFSPPAELFRGKANAIFDVEAHGK